MSIPEFQYFLRYEDTGAYKYYTVVNGVVTVTLTETPIVYAPKNWDAAKKEWERGFTYYGIFTKFTGQLEFVRDGAKILRHIYYTEGVEGKCELHIKRFNRTLAVHDYESYYIGDIDFLRAKDIDNYFAVEVTQAGFVSKLTARESTPYSYDVRENAERVWIKFHGRDLQYLAKWTAVTTAVFTFTGGGNAVDEYPLLNFLTSEGTLTSAEVLDVDQTATPNPQDDFIRNTSASPIDVNVAVKGNYTVTHGLTGDTFTVRLIEHSAPHVFLTTHNLYVHPTAHIPGTFTYPVDVNLTITLDPGHSFALAHFMDSTTNSNWSCTVDIECTASFANPVPVSYVPGLRIGTVYNLLMQSIGDNDINDSSVLLNVTHYDKVLVSGDALRNLPNSVIKTNFKELFNFVNAFQGCALTYNEATNIVALELKETAYQQTSIGDLGEVADIEVTPWTDEMYTNLRAGYQPQTYDEVNGKDEYNDEVNYLSPCIRVNKDANYVSNIRTDSYGAELHRLNLEGKTLTDASTDNDIWCFHIETLTAGTIPPGYDGTPENYFELYRKPIDVTSPGTNPNYWKIDNIYSPDTAYNIDFSPKRCLFNNAAWHAALLHNLDDKILTFQSSNKTNDDNLRLVTTEGTALTVTDEKSNIAISEFGTPMFKPVLIKCRIKTPIDINAIMSANPYGYFDFSYEGIALKGHILRIVDNNEAYEQQEGTMLATNTCAIENLIR